MAVAYEKIRKEFERIKGFIHADLDLILAPGVGGNYIGASLVTCACDALARHYYGSSDKGGELFSAKLLPLEWQPLGKTIYVALRNGLVHSYETKNIVINGKKLELSISRTEKFHLTFSDERKCLYLNLKVMAEKLRSFLSSYGDELQRKTELREHFYKAMKSKRDHHVKNAKEKAAWKAVLGDT